MTPNEIKVIKSFLTPAVAAGLISADTLAELLKQGQNPEDNERLEEMYTVQNAARLIQCHEKSVWRYIREERLVAVKIGKRAVRIPRSSMESFLNGIPCVS